MLVIVTVWGVLQLSAVKVRLAGLTVARPGGRWPMATVTSAAGWDASATVYVPPSPSSILRSVRLRASPPSGRSTSATVDPLVAGCLPKGSSLFFRRSCRMVSPVWTKRLS